jgi:hypothetical protein
MIGTPLAGCKPIAKTLQSSCLQLLSKKKTCKIFDYLKSMVERYEKPEKRGDGARFWDMVEPNLTLMVSDSTQKGCGPSTGIRGRVSRNSRSANTAPEE